jgi:hypothetical protein
MIDFFVANKGECGMAKPTEKQVKLLEGFGCDVPDGRRKAWRDIVHAGLSERVEAQGLHGVPNELRRAVAERESPERTEFSRRAAAFLSTSGIRVGSVVDRLGKMKVVVEMASARKIGIVNTMMPLCHNSIEAGSCVPGTIDFFPAFTLVANPPSGFVHIHCTGFFPEVEDPTADRKTFKHGDLHNFILSGINPEDRAEWGGSGRWCGSCPRVRWRLHSWRPKRSARAKLVHRSRRSAQRAVGRRPGGIHSWQRPSGAKPACPENGWSLSTGRDTARSAGFRSRRSAA